MGEPFINIKFPFKDSPRGYFLDMNKDSDSAIKSDLIHLLLTNKGERLYLLDFGANLRQYLFEPNDQKTHDNIRGEIQTAVNRYIPNLQIDDVTVTRPSDGELESEHVAIIRIDYTITEGVFQKSDFVIIQI